MPVPLEKLKSLLREERERFADSEKSNEPCDAPSDDEDLIQVAKQIWTRPLDHKLYKCPMSQPQTTLVRWSSLTRPVQDQLMLIATTAFTKQPPEDEDVVEVPLLLLQPVNNEETVGPSGGASRRPLGGNLSDKLSEYTRGVTGQSRPFRPGGLGSTAAEEERQGDSNEPPEDPYRSQEAIRRAGLPLIQGVEKSWKDGSLITAPPGVSFKVGLSWKDIHGEDLEKTSEEMETDKESLSPQPFADSSVTVAGNMMLPKPSVTQNMFSRDFFDDDSLFGSSSSSSGEDSDEDDSESDDDEEVNQAKDMEDSQSKQVSSSAATTPGPEGGEENVDDLLSELTLLDDGVFARKKKTGEDHSANILELAERHSQNQLNTTRKAWASTKLLPIRDFHDTVPNPAMHYPFTLDDFQQQAVARLERAESVFVAAHTSAGKTVVAEYAVAMAKQRGTRCVYTSPIKALSNQKFRDFSLKFGAENIGLITGDLQVNADDSTCLIMTTEILRSMLYRGADLIRDIEYVIFDEVHYINDTERGVVWEEVIIMLPSYVNLIFLSATTPNTLEFSDWIGRTKRRPVYVVKTDYRPVPLSFNLWAGVKLHCIMEGRGGFLENGFNSATKALLPASVKDKNKKDAKGRAPARTGTGSKQLAWQQSGSKQNWTSLVRFLDREELTPTVVFSFSKKKCEEIANMLRSLDLNTAKERSAVQGFTIQTVARLSQNDSKLPQVQMVCEMVQRGIGIHHGGLLPILKEMVEILFSRSLVKVLFATETFAMGVNMPARCVVFNSIRKHDGKNFRQLEPGELTQMAGRAGRRGLDKVGTVIICCFGEVPPPQPILKQMLTGSSTRLNSQFRLTYNMILNLLRVEEMSVESMIKRSFSEFATQRALTTNEYPQLLSRGKRTLEKLENEAATESRVGVEDIEQYYASSTSVLSLNAKILEGMRTEDIASFQDILQCGRIVVTTAARKHGFVRAPAIVLQCRSSSTSAALTTAKEVKSDILPLICLVLLPPGYTQGNDGSDNASKPGSLGYVGNTNQRFYTIAEISPAEVLFVTTSKCKCDVDAIFKQASGSPGHSRLGPQGDSRTMTNPFAGMKMRSKGSEGDDAPKPTASKYDEEVDRTMSRLLEVERDETEGVGASMLDLRNSLKRGEGALHFRGVFEEMQVKISEMRSYPSHRHPNLESHYGRVDRRETLRQKVETLEHLLSNESLQLFPDFLQRKEVLRELGYVSDDETVCIKGRVACETNTCDELIVTEIVFEGLLNDLEPEEIVAVLSALIFQERKDEDFDAELPEKLVACCQKMKAIAINLGELQRSKGLDLDPADYCDDSLKFGLVHVVYEWALGVPFQNICELTDVQEGSIVRTITRLDELCREVRNCARVVGNPTLYRKLEAASVAIKRDIVFASSLYVS